MQYQDATLVSRLLAVAALALAPLALVAQPSLELAAALVASLGIGWAGIHRVVLVRLRKLAAAVDRREEEYRHSLRLSENRFQEMARTAPTGIFRVDDQFRLTYANPWCLNLLGRREEEMREVGLGGCVHPDDRPWVLDVIERVRGRGTELELRECRILRPDGSVVWVLVRDKVERDEAGVVRGRIGTVVDVTTLKQTTEALRESEERFRKLARIAPVGIFRADGAGACTYANDSLSAILRRPKHELQGLDWRNLVHPDDRDRLGAPDGEIGQRELRLLRPDGREVWALVREVAERDWYGEVVGRIGTMFDITGQIMAREALRVSEGRFRVALMHSPVTVFAHDTQLRYTWIFNCPMGLPMVGRTDEETFAPDEARRLVEVKREVMATRSGRRVEMEVTIHGERHIFDTWYEPMLDEHGEVTGLVGAAVEVTAARKLEAALIEARELAERANEAKSRFLAAASHDLRQPFQAMRLFRAALTPFLTQPKAEELATKLDEAMTAGEQLLTALLDVSTLEAGIVTPKLAELDAADLVERLVREFQPQALAHGLTLKHHAWRARVTTDPVLLERMLRNLLHNAVRYTDKGGILLGTRKRGDRLVFQVWDTGIGIPPEQQEKVFEDFYQVGNPGRDRSRGLGLGLSVVARTARLLGHEVTLASRHGRGSVFSVAVPIAPLSRPAGEDA